MVRGGACGKNGADGSNSPLHHATLTCPYLRRTETLPDVRAFRHRTAMQVQPDNGS